MSNPHYTITVRGMPKYRPRVAGGKGYHEPRYKQWLESTGWAIMTAMRGDGSPFHMYLQDVSVSLWFAFCKHGAGDIDNLAGGFLDAANHILWDDDKRVRELHVYIARHTGKPDSIGFTVEAL